MVLQVILPYTSHGRDFDATGQLEREQMWVVDYLYNRIADEPLWMSTFRPNSLSGGSTWAKSKDLMDFALRLLPDVTVVGTETVAARQAIPLRGFQT